MPCTIYGRVYDSTLYVSAQLEPFRSASGESVSFCPFHSAAKRVKIAAMSRKPTQAWGRYGACTA